MRLLRSYAITVALASAIALVACNSSNSEPVQDTIESLSIDSVNGIDSGQDEPLSLSFMQGQISGDGFQTWKRSIQPELDAQCGSCHTGKRFGFASLEKAGLEFTDAETLFNYDTFLKQISLDSPNRSRLVVKTLPETDDRALKHGGGSLLDEGDDLYLQLNNWILEEKSERCPDCGLSADKAYVAYVDQPSIHWALARTPDRGDVPVRSGARLMLQSINPASLAPMGEPIDFLPLSFCPIDGSCDIGRIASDYNGEELVFECRLPVDSQDSDPMNMSWNLCIAGISDNGKAIEPRFLRPEGERHKGWFVSRTDPYGIADENGLPSRGQYDLHYRMRQMDDSYPVYSPDNKQIIFSSRSADPRTGVVATRTYHGEEFTNNIISTDKNGQDATTLYLNEGGLADAPLFLRNGNLAVHVWNLERMDRHLYVQSSADGMMEMPVLFGRAQGRNMWGPLTQLADGTLMGTTGHRRGSVSLFVPFHTDHTIGLGLDPEFPGFRILDEEIMQEMDDSFAYCNDPPSGRNCSTARFYADPSYSPDGRALITYSPERTYYANDDNGNSVYMEYGNSIELVQNYVPELQIALISKSGQVETLMQPAPGRSFRYPVFAGKRSAPAIQSKITDESVDTAEIHIADFPLWLSFREQQAQSRKRFVEEKLDQISSVRVLVKKLGANVCTNDGKTYRRATYNTYDHPTHLGSNNATGFDQLYVPQDQGGDGYGNIPLQADNSIRLRVPAGVLLLFQGIDNNGHMVSQHSRVFALPPGHTVDTSVKRSQHDAQCASCHGVVTGDQFPAFSTTAQLNAEMDFDTLATVAVDLSAVDRVGINFLENFRPKLDSTCVACHSGDQPAAELTLASKYSEVANAPHLKWSYALQTDARSGAGEGYADYLSALPGNEIVRGYNWSPALEFVLREGDEYLNTFVNAANPAAPVASYAPWDPGYQMLMISQPGTDGDYRYLTDWQFQTQVGRGGDWSRTSYLLEVLTGRDLDSRNDYSGPDHSGLFSDQEIRQLMALIDNGFPYASECGSQQVSNGPNAGFAWGDTQLGTDSISQ